MKIFVKFIFGSIVTLALILCTTAFLFLKPLALEKTYPTIDAEMASKGKLVLKQLHRQYRLSPQLFTLRLSQSELSTLSALLNKAKPNIHVTSKLNQGVATFTADIVLPLPRFIKLLSLDVTIVNSTQGLKVKEVKIGRLSFNGDSFVSVSRYLINNFVEPKLGDKLLSIIKSVVVSPSHIFASLQLPEELKNKKQSGNIVVKLMQQLNLVSDSQHFSYYYDALREFTLKNNGLKLESYVYFLLKTAKEQGASNKYSAVEENKAALMALSVYFGAEQFSYLVGDIPALSQQALVRQKALKQSVTLNGRVDLQKHFIYSIALQLFSGIETSDAIGEFKELLDSNGGSGFSFVDLLADRAGTRFAAIATRSDNEAITLQNKVVNNKPFRLLPAFTGLPENISKNKFKQNFKHIDHESYEVMLIDIDKRLQSINLYN